MQATWLGGLLERVMGCAIRMGIVTYNNGEDRQTASGVLRETTAVQTAHAMQLDTVASLIMLHVMAPQDRSQKGSHLAIILNPQQNRTALRSTQSSVSHSTRYLVLSVSLTSAQCQGIFQRRTPMTHRREVHACQACIHRHRRTLRQHKRTHKCKCW